MTLTLTVLYFFLSAAPQAQPKEPAESKTDSAGMTGTLTRAPEILHSVDATYPPDAKRKHLSGTVGLLVDIDQKGLVTRVEVIEPAGHGFDQAATEALRKFVFLPAEIDGKPAPVRIEYRYQFKLREEPTVPSSAIGVVNFRGRLLQRGNREPIIGATVSLDNDTYSATTNSRGEFELTDIPVGKHKIIAVALGFHRFATEEEILPSQATEVTYYLRKQLYSPYETIVRGKREHKEVARVELQQEEIRLAPGTGGDAFRVVQNLPGAHRTPYSFGLLIVRGGRPQDTRVYVDGVWIPMIFHFGGLSSVFNSDLLKDLSFQPGNFGAHSGRSIAGIVEANSRSPSKKTNHGYLNLSLMDSSGLAEGPWNENWSLAASGRVSYVDLVLRQVIPDNIQFLTAPRYWDYQVKLEYSPQKKSDQVRVMAFGAYDAMKLLLSNPALLGPEGRDQLGASTGFHRLLGTWTHSFAPSLKNSFTAALGTDSGSSFFGSDIRAELRLNTVQLRNCLQWEFRDNLSFEFGLDSYIGWFKTDVTSPPLPLPGEVPDPILSHQLLHNKMSGLLFEPGGWIEATFKPWKKLRIIPGLRFDYEHTLRYSTVDPRISLFYQFDEATLFKTAWGIYQQPPDFRFGQWTEEFGNPNLGPEKSNQAMAGIERRLSESIHIDLQLYYKWLDNTAFRSSRTIERDGKPVLERWNNSGEGRSYGVELLLRHKLTHRFFGWIAYSFSRTEERGKYWSNRSYRRHMFDQPHHLVMLASYKWPGGWITGARFQYSSGNLSTPFNFSAYDSDGDIYMPIPGKSNSVRGPAFYSLDLRIDKRFVFNQWNINAFLDIQNVTNNTNGEYMIYNYDYSKSQYIPGLPIFPTLGIKGEF